MLNCKIVSVEFVEYYNINGMMTEQKIGFIPFLESDPFFFNKAKG